MSKYVLVNVQGVHDVTTKVFDNDVKLYEYLEDFFEDDDEYTPDDLMPNGEVRLDNQTLKVILIKEKQMLLKDYVEGLTKLLNDDPEYGELEVWTYSDDEGNSILPMYEGSDSAFVEKDVHRETDEYIPSDYLKEYLDDYEISVEEFQQTHKQIILL